MSPIDAGRLTVSLAAGEEFLAVLALVGEPLQLSVLPRQCGAKIAVFEIEPETIAGDVQVGRIIGQLGVRIAVED